MEYEGKVTRGFPDSTWRTAQFCADPDMSGEDQQIQHEMGLCRQTDRLSGGEIREEAAHQSEKK